MRKTHDIAHLGFADEKTIHRLGIFGGTFDPIHIGHLAAAEYVRDALSLDALLFMPAGKPVFKLDRKIADAHDRLAMCRLACASNPFFDVSSLEIDREGVTYTVDTLRYMRRYYPKNVELYFISGADAMLEFDSWKSSEEVSSLAHLIGISRPGYTVDEDRKSALAPYHIQYVEVPALAISSSQLRAALLAGRSIRYLTPDAVVDYISEHGLYC